MPIYYALYDNNLTDDPDDRLARVTTAGVADQDLLIADIIESGSTVTQPDILAVLNAYHRAITRRLTEGMRIQTPIANFGLSIQGVFDGADDQFDPGRHTLNVTARVTPSLRRQVQQEVHLSKQEPSLFLPKPVEYIDFGSETKNSLLTPGGPGQLNGHRLKFDPADPKQGIFVVNQANNSAIRVDMVMHNKPAGLMFMLPTDLSPGDYILEVRTDSIGDRQQQRIGSLEYFLTVPSG